MSEMEQDRESRSQRRESVFRRYHLGWVLLSMVVAVVLVQLAGGGWDKKEIYFNQIKIKI